MAKHHAIDGVKLKSATDKRDEREKQLNANYGLRLERSRGVAMNFAFYRCHENQPCTAANEHVADHRYPPKRDA